jgi:hypothetical protein
MTQQLPPPSMFHNLKFRTFILSTFDATERLENTIEEVSKVGLLGTPVVLRSIRDTEDVRRGCWNAHMRVVSMIKSEKLDFGVVFEDDLKFLDGLDPKILNDSVARSMEFAENRIKTCMPLDAVFLGHLPMGSLMPITPMGGIVRCDRSFLTHAMIVGPNWVDKLISTNYDRRVYNGHVDQFLAKQPNVFSVYPMIAFQRNLEASEHASTMDKCLVYLRNTFGTDKLCKLTESVFSKF